MMRPFLDVVGAVATIALILVLATLTFDIVHALLHRFENARVRVFRWVGALHATHHAWFNRDLRHEDRLAARNILHHVIPETLTQQTVSWSFLLVADAVSVATASAVLLGFQGASLLAGGKDVNHRAQSRYPSPRSAWFVEPGYHARHHVHPETSFGSYFPLFDRLFGTSCPLRGRNFVVTGASGALGAPLCRRLERSGAIVHRLRFGHDWTYSDYQQALPLLASCDVLVLAHGSKVDNAIQANCTSFVTFIELLRLVTKSRRLPPEVWAVGSEIECHPTFGVESLKVYAVSKRAYSAHARRYFHDPEILYRHIVPSAFTSRMGPGLVSGGFVAAAMMFWIRRGFRYVPVSYTGIGILNYCRYLVRPRRPAEQNREVQQAVARAISQPYITSHGEAR